MKEVSFKAPWSLALKVMTIACLAICLLLPIPGVLIILGRKIAGLNEVPSFAGWLVVFIPIVTALASAAFMVRRYIITDDLLIIKRLGWENRFELSRLVSATADPNATSSSIRLFGNAGFFGFVGIFRSDTLGTYRAYATDVKNSVVLRFGMRTIVVTPDDPQKFLAEISPKIIGKNPDAGG